MGNDGSGNKLMEKYDVIQTGVNICIIDYIIHTYGDIKSHWYNQKEYNEKGNGGICFTIVFLLISKKSSLVF